MWRWIRRWWYLPFLAVGLVLGWFLWRRWFPGRGSSLVPVARIKKELRAIDAGVRVEKLRVELGHDQAIQHIEDKYKKELEVMTEERKVLADKLRQDPEALTRFIIRGSS